MAGNYVVEIIEMASSGRDWISRGFFKSGAGTSGDAWKIGGREQAYTMSQERAKQRVERIRAAGHKARILDSDDRVILDWSDPLVKPQELDRWNQHVLHEYRGLRCVEDRATGKFHHRFAWPVQAPGSPERVVTSDSIEGIVSRLQEMHGDVPAYLAATLDREDLTSAPVASSPKPIGQPIATDGAIEVTIGYRPGSFPL